MTSFTDSSKILQTNFRGFFISILVTKRQMIQVSISFLITNGSIIMNYDYLPTLGWVAILFFNATNVSLAWFFNHSIFISCPP